MVAETVQIFGAKTNERSKLDIADCKHLHDAEVQMMCGRIIDAMTEFERFDPWTVGSPWYQQIEKFTKSWQCEDQSPGVPGGEEGEMEIFNFLMRGGGKAGKKKKTTKPASAKDAPEAKDPKQSEKANAFNRPVFKPNGICFDKGLLVQEHWDVPVVLHKDMHFGKEGVCVATRDTYEAMVGILIGAPTKTAMLVPAHLEVEATLVVAWAKMMENSNKPHGNLCSLGILQ